MNENLDQYLKSRLKHIREYAEGMIKGAELLSLMILEDKKLKEESSTNKVE